MITDVECVDPAGAILGEGPIWDEVEGVVYWVDIKGPAIHRFNPGTGEAARWPVAEEIGCIARRRDKPGFVAGLKTGFAFVDPEAGTLEKIGNPEPDHPENRFNDGKVDAAGRFWAGTLDDLHVEPTGWLYRLDPDLVWTPTDGPYIITNGPTFTPDGSGLYHTDTFGRSIWRFDLDDDGMLSHRRLFVRFEDDDWGYPDGMTTDAEGFVWIAHHGGGRVTRFDPDGKVERVLKLPASKITSACFAGPNLDQLYITSDSRGTDQATEPLAGGLFRAAPGTTGLPCGRFAG